MAAPFVSGGGPSVTDPEQILQDQQNPTVPPQDPTVVPGLPTGQPTGPSTGLPIGPSTEQPADPRDVMIAQLQAAVQALELRVNQLGAQAGAAVTGLGQQVQQAQQGATMAAGLATRGAASGVRIPQPQRFKGNREGPKVLEWAHQATTYLKAAGLDQTEVGVWHISSFLEGDAAVWWRLQCDRIDRGAWGALMPANWDEFKRQLLEQFKIFNHVTDIRDQYTALRQTASVSAYITKFRSLVVELPEEPEEHQVYQFLKGLKPEIQARTRTHKPATLAMAMDIADEADRAHYHAYRGSAMPNRFVDPLGYSRPNLPDYSSPTPDTAVPMRIGAVTPANAVLAPHELQRLRQEDRCFNCQERGHTSRDCPVRKKNRGDAQRQDWRQPDD